MYPDWSTSASGCVRSGQVSLVVPCCPMSGTWSRRDTADIALDSRKSDRVILVIKIYVIDHLSFILEIAH